MELRMGNFSCEIAQVVLFLYCLTQTHIECGKDNDIELPKKSNPQRNFDAIFTTVRYDGLPYSHCGAAWISGNCLLTAASCLDKNGLIDLPKTENSLIKIEVMKTERLKFWYSEEKSVETYGGKIGAVIAHPSYRRVNGMTIAYDLAVVRVNFDNNFHFFHKTGTLCKNDNPNSKLIALGLRYNEVYQWELEKDAENDIAIVDNHRYKKGVEGVMDLIEGVEYFIDHRKQFTAHLDQKTISGTEFAKFTKKVFGGPVLDQNKGRCILGIMNFAAVKEGKYYITSTKVTPVIDWIEYTMNYLRDATGQSKLTILHGKAGMKYRKLRGGVNPDPIGKDPPPGITPGEPVNKTAKESQRKPGKPLR